MSIREALEAAMAGQEQSETPAPVEEQPTEQPEPIEAVEAEQDDLPVDEDDDDGAEELDEPAPVNNEYPGHWSDADREIFQAIPEDAREWVMARDTAAQEAAKEREKYTALEKVLAPHREQFARAGQDEATVVNQLHAAQRCLQTNPAEAVQWLAQSAGVDLSQLVKPAAPAEEPDEWVDPQIASLQQRLDEQNKALAALQTQQQRERETAYLSQVQAFADQKTAEGDLAHPHMEAAMPAMAALLQSAQAAHLPEAYEKAIWMTPEIREKIMAENRNAEAKEKTTRAKRAKRAARDVKSEAAPVEPTKPMSLREQLIAAYQAQN